MNKRTLGALIALNLVLLVALAVVNFTSQPVHGQGFAGGGGDYVMLAGSVTWRSDQQMVYIIELRSAKMVAVMFNSNTNELELIDWRDVTADAQGGGR